jgi:UDP-N-acetylmuramoyl-tripeptide--D-alanyl-D-alanine ligase
MGMNRPGEIGRLTEIARPDIGLITNVGRAHLEGVRDIKGVARAKTELLEKISLKSRVIINGDDDLLLKEASLFKRDLVTFGTRRGNDIRADNIKIHGKGGFSFRFIYKDTSFPLRIKVPGSYNIFNALAASSIALFMNIDLEDISKGLDGFRGIKGRFAFDYLPGDILLIDDTYNSNPSSLKAAIDSLNDIAGDGGRIIIGLGEMMELGDETLSAHREAGRMVAELGAAYFCALGDHAGEMIKGAREKGFDPAKATEAKSHKDMVQKIENIMEKGDLIFLKGSRKAGLEQVIRGLKKKRGL